MLNIGFSEILVIVVVALIFVGPKKLPELMKKGGKYFVQMRRAAQDVRSAFDQVVREAEDEVRREEIQKLQKFLTEQEEDIKARLKEAPAVALSSKPEGSDEHTTGGSHLSSHHDPDVLEAPPGSVSLGASSILQDSPSSLEEKTVSTSPSVVSTQPQNVVGKEGLGPTSPEEEKKV